MWPLSPSVLPLCDAHNHLQDDSLLPHRQQIAEALTVLGIKWAVVNGTHELDWKDVTSLASAHRWVLPSFGIHPWQVGNRSVNWQENFRRAFDECPGAVGEIGIDRWMLERAKKDDPRLTGLRRASLPEQLDVFCWQLEYAADRNLAVTIHCLDAWGALTEALGRCRLPKRGFLLHAYSGPIETVQALADKGAYFSFNAHFLRDAEHVGPEPSAKARPTKLDTFAKVRIDRLLVETDAPAMILPASVRTHELPLSKDGAPTNHPANIGAAYKALASIRRTSVKDLASQVEKNFVRLFGKGK